MEKIFHLFACCVPFKGHRRSLIVDTQRSELFYIPNGLYDMLQHHKEELLVSKEKVVAEYLEFLLQNELGFVIEKHHHFPQIEWQWESASRVSNALFEIEDEDSYDMNLALSQIIALGCRNIYIKFLGKTTLDKVQEVFEVLKKHDFNSVDVCVSHDVLDMEKVTNFVYANPIIRNFILTDAEKNEMRQISEDGMSTIVLEQRSMSESKKLTPNLFNLSLKFIDESRRFHNHLHKKISIDSKGFVKNLPTFIEHFGHIDTTSLEEVISNKDFRDPWFIQKDQVSICKDCEHRYICPQITTQKEEIYSKPKACNYNPYTAQWENES